MKKLRVAFISQPFEYIASSQNGGSIAIWTDRVMASLANQPVEFVVYARQFPGQPLNEKYKNIEYRRIPVLFDEQIGRAFRIVEKAAAYPFPRRPFFSSSLNFLEYSSKISRDIRSTGSDIVHIHNFSQFVTPVRRENPNVKIVLHMACDWLVQLDSHLIERRLRFVDQIIGCSNHVIWPVAQKYPQHAHKSMVILNGVDPKRFVVTEKSQSEEKRLLFVGRVSPEKGIHILIHAFKQVLFSHPEAKLDIVGPFGSVPFEYIPGISDEPMVASLSRFYKGRLRRDDYRQNLLRLISPDMADKVQFVGTVPHDQMMDYYQRASMLINPSLSEAFGMSLVEAMASGLPVIATCVGGMKEIVGDGEVGLLVKPDDPTALANAIIKLLDNEMLCKQMGTAGRIRSQEKYDWNTIGAELMQLYHQLVSK